MKHVFFDFHNVLSKYDYDKAFSPEVYAKIDEIVIGDDWELFSIWNEGRISSADLYRKISERLEIPFDELYDDFVKGEMELQLNEPLMNLVEKIRTKTIKVGIISDNVDTFTTHTVPHKKLHEKFDFVINSADHGKRKYDNGALFDKAIEVLNLKDFSDSFLVDDAPENSTYFQQRNGEAFQYVYGDDQPLIAWLEEKLDLKLS